MNRKRRDATAAASYAWELERARDVLRLQRLQTRASQYVQRTTIKGGSAADWSGDALWGL